MEESGLCQCGCGEKTPIATRNRTHGGFVKGKPIRYIRGHFKWGPVNAWLCPHTTKRHIANGLCNSCYRKANNSKSKARYHAKKEEMGLVQWRAYRQEKHIRSRYNLPWDKYQEKLAEQNHVCICGREFNKDGGKKDAPHIDHNHACCSSDTSCGKCVRGILCFRCNTVLGYLENDPHLLPEYLKVYLAKYPLS